MSIYKEKELVFNFNNAEKVEKLDEEGVPLPSNMKLVDFVVEEENRTLLIEIKDPSHSKTPEEERNKYAKKILGDELINDELVPKVRDAYTYLHLMERDSKPFIYVVVLGLERYKDEKALLLGGFKERLLKRIRKEAKESWKRKYIKECIVLTIDGWNALFQNYPVSREITP